MTNRRDIVHVEDLLVTYSRFEQTIRALDGIGLTVPAGQALMVTGRNGSGKSTLLSVLCGSTRTKPARGTVLIDGTPIGQLTRVNLPKLVFLVHQDPLAGTVATMTVFENLLVADEDARIQNKTRVELLAKYDALLRPVGLAERLRQQAEALSPGQRQVLTVLIARLRPAKLVLLDEPLASLDPTNAEICLSVIRGLKKLGKTLIYVTHRIEQTESFADRIVTLSEGSIVSDTTPQDATQ